MKDELQSFAVGQGFSRWFSNCSDYDQGNILTKHGVVIVYMQGDERYKHHTRLDFIYNGRCYMQSFHKRYSRRGVVTKAKQFAALIAEGG